MYLNVCISNVFKSIKECNHSLILLPNVYKNDECLRKSIHHAFTDHFFLLTFHAIVYQ